MENMIKIETTNEKENGVSVDQINAEDLLKLVYLTAKADEIAEEIPKIGSSRSKDDESFRWRYAANKSAWLEAGLFYRKAAALDKIIYEMQKLEQTNPVRYAMQLENLKTFKAERDELKAYCHSFFAKGDELLHQNACIESYEIYLGDLQLSAIQITEVVEKMDEKTREAFKTLYNKICERYTIKVKDEKSAPVTSGPVGMGE